LVVSVSYVQQSYAFHQPHQKALRWEMRWRVGPLSRMDSVLLDRCPAAGYVYSRFRSYPRQYRKGMAPLLSSLPFPVFLIFSFDSRHPPVYHGSMAA
jgi:hypothetical protein